MARWVLALALALCAGSAAPVQPPRCLAPQRCVRGGTGRDEYSYTVDGLDVLIEYTDSGYFALQCSENLTLDNPALPRFESQLRVNKVQLKDCPAPRGSYGAVLAALNVSVGDKLRVIGAGQLAAAHFDALPGVRALELVRAQLEPGALAALPRLRRLFLDAVRLPPDALLQLPRALRSLELMRVGADVPAAALQRLPELRDVVVRDSRSVRVALGGGVRALALEMPAARVPSALAPALRRLTVYGWDAPRPAPWAACALEALDVRDVTAEQLPARWASDCAALRVLRVQGGPRLRALHATCLHGAGALQELYVTSCALEALPAGLLDDAVNLTVLDLSGNFLKELSGLFVKTSVLRTLDLSKNRLTKEVYHSLKSVTSLTTLHLSNNDLKDSCGNSFDTVRDTSPLDGLTLLRNLYLRRTNTSLICRDWREILSLLEVLDLRDNSFTSLTYVDLQFRGTAEVKVMLTGNNVTRVQYTQNDYERAVSDDTPVSRAVVTLDDTLACDCDSYWAALALQRRAAHVRLRARCAGGAALGAAPAAMLCAAPQLCGAACSCATRPGAPRAVLRVRCERAGLARVRDALPPRALLPAPERFDWQLHLAHNRIADLGAADLPAHLEVLDLTNNSLSAPSARALRDVLARSRRVLLARNPLACDCRAADALAALRAAPALADLAALTCADGSALRDAAPAPCAARGLGAGALAAGAALATLLGAAALAALLCRPALRLRLKAALHARGWLPARAEPDDARRFDAFVSFSHADERFVRDELVARLESGPAPYRLCVHYRDWAPGGWIPAQIAASVRASRRTVAVVSAHFLRSAWARAEFQEAYALALRDARPRLVVVLLDEPAALPLDDKLRAYLATNTYVRWGDPWFWQKLRLALPRGRGLAPPAPPDALPGRAGPAPERAGPAPERPGPAPEHPEHTPARPGPAPDACSEPSAAPALNSPTISSCSSSPSSGSPSSSSSSLDSPNSDSPDTMELTRLMSCGALCARDLSSLAQPVPV